MLASTTRISQVTDAAKRQSAELATQMDETLGHLDRAQLFEGRVLLEVESGLNAAIEHARAALERAQNAVQSSASDVIRLQEAVRQATQLVD